MYILAIDTGSHDSAYVLYNEDTQQLADKNKLPNLQCIQKFKKYLDKGQISKVLIEQTSSNGIPVGMEVFMNCEIIGFFVGFLKQYPVSVELIFRKTVKMALCGAIRKVTDASVNLMVREEFGEDNTQKRPNLFYFNDEVKENNGLQWMNNDVWASLAIILTYLRDKNVQSTQTEIKKIDKEYLMFLNSTHNFESYGKKN